MNDSKAVAGFNPLNQVYVFNSFCSLSFTILSSARFNPLNQVYVFNMMNETVEHFASRYLVLIP